LRNVHVPLPLSKHDRNYGVLAITEASIGLRIELYIYNGRLEAGETILSIPAKLALIILVVAYENI